MRRVMRAQERRKFQRFELRLLGIINLNNRKHTIHKKVLTKNISASGAYLITKVSPEIGDEAQLNLNSFIVGKEPVGAQILRIEELLEEIHGIAVSFQGAPFYDQDLEGVSRIIVAVRPSVLIETKKINGLAFEHYAQLQRVKRLGEERYKDEIPLRKAAQVAAMEATYFSSFFHKKVGIPFHDWLTQVRITKALDLMETGDYSISEVAFGVGFKALRTFERAFKKCTSLTPREFRKLIIPD